MQRTGAAIHSAKACYWDTVSDGQEDEQNMDQWEEKMRILIELLASI